MTLSTLAGAPRVVSVPVTTSSGARTATGLCDRLVLARVEPFAPGEQTMAQSAGAGDIFGAPSPSGDDTRSVKFKISDTDIAAAADVVGQVAASGGRATAGRVIEDLTVSLGIITTGELPIGTLPAKATTMDAAGMLGAILLVNGVPYIRLPDGVDPAAGEFAVSASDKTVLVIGADSTNYLPVGADIEILKPDTALTARLAKLPTATGAALVAGVPEGRQLAIPYATTDTAGRSVTRALRVDFLAANTATVVILGVDK